MSGANRKYTDIDQSGIDSKVERVGDITGDPPTNGAMDRNKAAKMANSLEGLEFPATKEKIKNHLNSRSPSTGNTINDIVEAIENNLEEDREYDSAYDVEVAAGIVAKRDESKIGHPKDIEPNRTNPEGVGRSERPNSYVSVERISGASSKDVSPNTPKGEDL
jgi:hypothetical protein